MLTPAQLANAAYTCLLSPRPLPTITRRDSTPQGRQYKLMYVPRNYDLVELWAHMRAACPPQMANAANISPFDRGLNRRVCGNKALSSDINLSLWTCFEVKNWWCYGLIYLYTLPPARLKTISLPLVKVHCVVRSSSAFILASTWIDHHWASQQSQLCGPFIEHVPLS
jgi:hypothetical protein